LRDEEIHIIRGIKAGDEQTYSHLFETYYRVLSVFAFRYVTDLEVASEIVQDLFVHIYENRQTLMISTSLKSYLYQSVRNRCLNHLKQVKNHGRHLDELTWEVAESLDPETIYHETELESRVFQIVSDLPSRCQEIFIMSRVEGKKNSEIASKLKLSVRTVETQISRALKILRKKMG